MPLQGQWQSRRSVALALPVDRGVIRFAIAGSN
jgi:hypothetical protein